MSTGAERDEYDDLSGDLERWRIALDRGSFEETYEALEAVVARLERGQMRLDESVACYELGVRLARRCGQILDNAELRVSRLDEAIEMDDEWVGDEHDAAAEIDEDQTG